MNVVTLFLLVTFNTFFIYQSQIDSLAQLLYKTQDSTRYTLLSQIADEYYYQGNLEISATYYKKAADFASRQDNPNLRHLSESFGNYGYCLYDLGNYDEAISWYQHALVYAVENNDSIEIATHFHNIGLSYFLLGDYTNSIENYQKTLAIDRALNNQESLGIDYSVIGNVYVAWAKYENASNFFKNALEIARTLKNREQICRRLNKLGSSLIELQLYDSAFILFEESLALALEIGNPSLLGSTYNQTGYAYQSKGELTKAQDFYELALEHLNETNDTKNLAMLYSNACSNCYMLEDYTRAKLFCARGLKTSGETGLIRMTMRNYELLSKIYYETAEYKNAHDYYLKYSAFKDSLFNQESQQKFAEFEVLHETEKKENEIALLNNQKLLQQVQIDEAEQRFYFLIIISVLLLFMAGLFYYLYLVRRRVNMLLGEKNAELEQLNATKDRFISIIAHDLKNPFTAFYNIASVLYQKKEELSQSEKDRLIESIYHSSIKLKELLKSLLDWVRLQKDNLPVQLTRLNINEIADRSISINETIINTKHVKVLNKIQENLEIFSHKETLLTVFNNLLSNALKFSKLKGVVILASNQYNNSVDIIVEDNGIGLSQTEIEKLFRIDTDPRMIGNSKEKGTGMGLILCKELLEKIRGKIRVESEHGKGSKFIVSLPDD